MAAPSAAFGLAPVYLLGGRLNTLSAARSLGQRGVAVNVLDDRGEGSLVARSRHCRHYADTPSGLSTPAWWLDVLRSRAGGAVVFPCSDTALEFLARNRQELESAGCLPIEADGDALLLALDKEATYARARALGVPAPKTIRLGAPEDVELALAALTFPFAVKPTSAHRFWQALRGDRELLAAWLAHPKGLVVEDERSFRAAVRPLTGLGIEVLATEVVVGPDSEYSSYYTYLDPDGEPLVHFTKRKTRQYPIHFGQGTFHMTAWLPDVAELGLQLCLGLGLRGICNVEFKRDSRTGELQLIECNARLTASDALERKAGLDLPWIAYLRAVGDPVTAPATLHYGDHQWLPLVDLKAFRAYRRAGELTTAAWLRSLAHRQTFTVFDPSDLGPIYASAVARTRSTTRRLFMRPHVAASTAGTPEGEQRPEGSPRRP